MDISREIRFLISKYDFKPKERLGQNFLISNSALNFISEIIAPRKDKNYIEIGAGFLFLTNLIASNANMITAIEKDLAYSPYYGDFLKENPGCNIKIIIGDALDLNLRSFNAEELYGNIPYNISSRLVVKIAKENSIKRAVLLFQKEFAERILSSPNKKKYGTITVLVDMMFNKIYHKNLPESYFLPKPKIQSTLIELIRKEEYGQQHEEILKLVRRSFSMRRKKIVNNLCELYPYEKVITALKSLNLPEDIRAERLSCSEFINLYSILSS